MKIEDKKKHLKKQEFKFKSRRPEKNCVQMQGEKSKKP